MGVAWAVVVFFDLLGNLMLMLVFVVVDMCSLEGKNFKPTTQFFDINCSQPCNFDWTDFGGAKPHNKEHLSFFDQIKGVYNMNAFPV